MSGTLNSESAAPAGKARPADPCDLLATHGDILAVEDTPASLVLLTTLWPSAPPRNCRCGAPRN